MGQFSVTRFLKEQWSDLELVKTDLTGKTVIVTGSNVGIGFETAKHLAMMKPAKLILACRDGGRANEAKKRIQEVSKLKDGEIMAWHLDLGVFSSVVAFANKFKAEGGGRLDILVENAAISMVHLERTQDGWEKMLQIDYLSNVLLALLLLPIMSRTASSGPTPRLVMVSSDAHYFINSVEDGTDPKLLEKYNDENYQTPSSALIRNRYFIVKVLLLFFARSLAALLPPENPLTVVSVNPGLCHSELARYTKGISGFIFWLIKFLFGRTAEMGSRTLVWAALGGEKTDVHGRYLGSCEVNEESDWMLGKEALDMQENIWGQTINILKKYSPEVAPIVTANLVSH